MFPVIPSTYISCENINNIAFIGHKLKTYSKMEAFDQFENTYLTRVKSTIKVPELIQFKQCSLPFILFVTIFIIKYTETK